ncbi:hypothetical protein LIER_04237 [Lithospermum erythrorhizon]|uniref:Pentatricopeptide repeat-containing protein n=1 Tax=Lithospermum erythrorhizon TaxID=34254 RepID=A0AAV3NWG0_LITER
MNKRVCKLFILFHTKYSPNPPLNLPKSVPKILSIFIRKCSTTSSEPQPLSSNIVAVFSGKFTSNDSKANKKLNNKVSILRDELLLGSDDDVERVEKVLEEKGVPLFRMYSDGSAAVQLLHQLYKKPTLALEVLSWRRRQVDYSALISSEEYAKGIAIAGRLKNVDLAVELFKEARNKALRTTSIYNALMSVYMYNGLSTKCQKLFQDLKKDAVCRPTIVTYNILICIFGRMLLTDRMEEILREIRDQNLSPDLKTYNNIIGGYVTAWMWDSMEKSFRVMQASSVEPTFATYKLMLRGYSLSGQLNKMEEIFELMIDRITDQEVSLIRCMIFAYCKSLDVNRVNKVEKLLMLLPQGDYRPSLNVVLITLYAKECMVEKMESAINEAFEKNTSITTSHTMQSIICGYFRCHAADRLADFVKRAEIAGWKINRSLYHCKMVMYSSQRRMTEMEGVLDEMNKLNMGCSKKTFWILYKAYKQWNQESRLHQVVGIMCTLGYGVPFE